MPTYAGNHDDTEFERERIRDIRTALENLDNASTHDPRTAVRSIGDILTAIGMILRLGSMEADADAEPAEWLGRIGDEEPTDPSSSFWQHVFTVRDAAREAAEVWERHQQVETNYFVAHDAYQPNWAHNVIHAARECRSVMQP